MISSFRFRLFFFISFLIFAALACSLPGNGADAPDTKPTPVEFNQVTPTENIPFPPTTAVSQELVLPTPEISKLAFAYVNQNQLFFWFEGKTQQLTSTGDAFNPQLSEDGQWIAFLRTADDYHLEIWGVKSDGTGERRLVSIADMDAIGGSVRDPASVAINPYHIRWLPNSHTLAFNSHQVFQGPGLTLLNDLNLVDIETGKIQNLFLAGWGGEFYFSSDGSKVAISQPDKIILSNSDGSDYRTILTYDPVTTYSEYRYYAAPVWSPDSQVLFVALPPVDPLANPLQPTEIWEIPIDGTNPQKKASLNAVPFFEQPVVFSENLEHLAYVKETGSPEQNQRELYLASNQGTEERLYSTGSPLIFRSWAPDGNHFIYSTVGENETWVGSISESPRRLSPMVQAARDIRWVDNNHFIFWRAAGNSFDIFLGDLNGGLRLLESTSGSPPNISLTH